MLTSTERRLTEQDNRVGTEVATQLKPWKDAMQNLTATVDNYVSSHQSAHEQYLRVLRIKCLGTQFPCSF